MQPRQQLQQAVTGIDRRYFPGVTHVVIQNSPCGLKQVMLPYLASLGANIPEVSCYGKSAITLDGTDPATNAAVKSNFGTPSLYGGNNTANHGAGRRSAVVALEARFE